MRYVVLWSAEAEARLADFWNGSANRKAISDVANAIDRLRETDPLGCGESREDETRVLLVPPLGVLFAVDEQERRVRVLTVWQFATRRGS